MSGEPDLVPEYTPMTEEAMASEEGTGETSVAGAPVLETPEREEPLNAEEATLLVVSFLKRLEKKIVTPRKAIKTDGNFVVDVELKDATATVQINVDSWKIVEYTISPLEIENKPLPFPPRKIAMALAGVAAVIVFLMAFSFFRNNMAFIITNMQGINTDYLIYGAVVIATGGIVLWWRRRS
jgi:hypothetical protein